MNRDEQRRRRALRRPACGKLRGERVGEVRRPDRAVAVEVRRRSPASPSGEDVVDRRRPAAEAEFVGRGLGDAAGRADGARRSRASDACAARGPGSRRRRDAGAATRRTRLRSRGGPRFVGRAERACGRTGRGSRRSGARRADRLRSGRSDHDRRRRPPLGGTGVRRRRRRRDGGHGPQAGQGEQHGRRNGKRHRHSSSSVAPFHRRSRGRTARLARGTVPDPRRSSLLCRL